MENNCKQKVLSPVERLARSAKLEDIVQDLVSRCGLAALADEIGVDKAALSRFRSGEGALTLPVIEKLLDSAEVLIVRKDRYRAMLSAVVLFSDLVREAAGE